MAESNQSARRRSDRLRPISAPQRLHLRQPRAVGLSVLVASVILSSLLLLPILPSPRASDAVLWGEVVTATSQVEFVHAISYWDKADRWNHGGTIDRSDTYYRNGGFWRGHGWGCVHFLTP